LGGYLPLHNGVSTMKKCLFAVAVLFAVSGLAQAAPQVRRLPPSPRVLPSVSGGYLGNFNTGAYFSPFTGGYVPYANIYNPGYVMSFYPYYGYVPQPYFYPVPLFYPQPVFFNPFMPFGNPFLP